MITEQQALEIAREVNCLTIPKSNGVEVLPPNFTRALNLAVAMALEGRYLDEEAYRLQLKEAWESGFRSGLKEKNI